MYGKWLFKEIKTEYGLCRVEIYRKGYTASAVEIGAIVGDSLMLSLENMGAITDAIGKSVCSFSIIDTAQVEYDDFFTPDATAYKVVVSTMLEGGAYVTRWSGYVTPDFFAENLSYRTPISISARDNIGYLSDVDFDLDVATITVRGLIEAAFNRIAEDYPMELVFETQKQTEDGILAIDATISTYLLRELSWYEAIETVLHDLGLQMRWVDNNAIAILDVSQLGEIFALQRFNFIDNSGYREILPAWRELAQEQSYGVLDNFYKGHIDGENKLEYAANSAINSNILLYQPKSITQWSRQGEVYFLNFYNSYNAEIDDDKQDAIFITGIAPSATNTEVLDKKMVYSQAVTEVDKQIKMTFSLNDTLRTPLASQYSRGERNTLYLPYSAASGTTMLKTPHPYQLKYRFNIFLRANDGTNYVMREDWVEEAALNEQPFIEFLTDKLQTVDTGVTDGQGNHRFAYTGYNNSKEYSITIGSIPKAGTLEFVVYPWTFEQDAYLSVRDAATYQRGAKISNIEFSVQVGKTGVEARTQIGVLHNIAEKINYSFGQVPQREGDVITYAGGLFQSDTITALQGFRRNANSTIYPLLELVGREVIHFNKKNYTKLSGTAKNLAKEPLMFNKILVYKGKNYLPFACSLDIISNTMNITTMQEVEPYMTQSFVEIKSELITGGGATISGGNNTALQYSAEVGNAKRISELNNASETEKKEGYIVIDNASWNESKKVPLSEMEGLDEAQVEAYLTENKYAKQSWVKGITDDLATDIANAVNPLFGYFDASGNANNALKLNGHSADYYATADALTRVANTTSAVEKRVTTLEDLGLVRVREGSTYYIKSIYSIVSEGELISGRRASGSSSDVTGGGGISQVTAQMIVDALGYVPYSSQNPSGYITSSALNGYATQAWVEGKKYLTAIPSEYITETELSNTLGGYQTKITSSNKLAYSLISGTPTSLPASDVYDWAKAATKPSYTASEVGALSTSGGKMTGTITVGDFTAFGQTGGNFYLGTPAYPLLLRSNGTTTINGNTLIHSGNIGSQKVERARYIETLDASGTSWYGDSYRIYGQWASETVLDWKVTGYEVRVDKAKKLNTARTIWGQSFDGTGDVSGGLADVTSILFNTANGIGIYRGSVYSGALTATDIAVNGSKIVLNPTGNVLIGTTTDGGAKLQVNGAIQCNNIEKYDNRNGYFIGGRNYGLGVTDGGALIYSYGATPISFYTSQTEMMRITGGGNVLIGTTTDNGSGAKLQVSGNLTATGEVISTRRATSSDARLKDNINRLLAEDCLAMVRNLQPSSWDWKENGEHSMGFIAQDIEPLMPYAVTRIKDDKLGEKLNLQYDQFFAPVVGAIQCLDSEVEQLKKRVKYLENKLQEYGYNRY